MADRTAAAHNPSAAATPEEAADRVVAAYAANDRTVAAIERAALAAYEPDNAPYGWAESHLIGAEARRIAATLCGPWGEPLILTVPSAPPLTEAEANGPAYDLATRMLALPADLYGNPHSGSSDPHHEERMAESRAIVGIMQDAAALQQADTVDDPTLRAMLADLNNAAAFDKAGLTGNARERWADARKVAERFGDAPALTAARYDAQRSANRTGRDVVIYRATRTGAYFTRYAGEYEAARHAFGPIVAIEQLSPQSATAPAAPAAAPADDRPLQLAALADCLGDVAAATFDRTVQADLYRIADAIRVLVDLAPAAPELRAEAEELIASLEATADPAAWQRRAAADAAEADRLLGDPTGRHEADQLAAETAYRAAVLGE
jgi:hypothetical protein